MRARACPRTAPSLGGTITRSVIRAPATAQEGEALTLIVYTVAAGRLKGKVVWLVPDSQSSKEALEAYYESPKTHGMMSQIFSQVLGGRPLGSEPCIQIVPTGLPAPTPSAGGQVQSPVSRSCPLGCLLQPHLRGDRMFRRSTTPPQR